MKVQTIVRAKRLLGGKDFQSLDNPVIGVDNGGIVFIDQGSTVHEGVDTIDLKDTYILPGFIDAHVHLIFGGQRLDYEQVMERDTNDIMLLRAVNNGMRHLEGGVTTIRDLGDRDGVLISLKEAIEREIVTGPRMMVSGPPLTPTGGHFHFCHGEVDGEDEIRKKVRTLHKMGVDLIKIMASGGTTRGSARRQPSFTVEELSTIVDESHKLGMPTSAHVHCVAAIKNCLDARVDCLEHLGFFDSTGRARIDRGLIERMAETGTYACITPKNSYLGIKRLRDSSRESDRRRLKELEYEFENRIKTLQICFENGVNLIAGTDSIWEFGDFHIFVEILVEAGLPPKEVLEIATIGSARGLGLESQIGTVEEGKCADFLGFEKNPISDISITREPRFIMKGGKIIAQRKVLAVE